MEKSLEEEVLGALEGENQFLSAKAIATRIFASRYVSNEQYGFMKRLRLFFTESLTVESVIDTLSRLQKEGKVACIWRDDKWYYRLPRTSGK